MAVDAGKLQENPEDRPGEADGGSSDVLMLVYDELRALARSRMGQEGSGHTLQATALVHEAYLRLTKGGARFENRAHFFHAAAEAMRKILIEHARRHSRLKRGAGAKRVPLNVLDLASTQDPADVLALDEAIERLGAEMPTAAAVVRLRFYAGMTAEETAEALGVAVRTVHREWAYARARLFRELRDDSVP